jgi:hypothetical protein
MIPHRWKNFDLTKSLSSRLPLLRQLPTPPRRTQPSTSPLPRHRQTSTPALLLRLPPCGQPNKTNLMFRPRPPNQAKPPCPRSPPMSLRTTCPTWRSIFLAQLRSNDSRFCSSNSRKIITKLPPPSRSAASTPRRHPCWTTGHHDPAPHGRTVHNPPTRHQSPPSLPARPPRAHVRGKATAPIWTLSPSVNHVVCIMYVFLGNTYTIQSDVFVCITVFIHT